LLFLQVLLEELHQAVNQAAAATNHVQAAFMLMLLQEMVKFVFEVGHWSSPALDSPQSTRHPTQTPEAVVSTLTLPAEDLGLEILIVVISKMNVPNEC
jgi:hypothetical protein